MVKNPFLNIIPSDDEEFVSVVNLNEVESKIKQNNIVLIVGDVGSGKSHLIREIKRQFGGKILHFSSKLLDEIRETKEGILYLEDFDLIMGYSRELRQRILKLISDKSSMGIKFVIEVNPRTAKMINLEAEKIIIPEFDFDTAMKIVNQKLNAVGAKNPFSEEELRRIWKKSGHNPRMFLMLLSSLYDIKVSK